MVVVVVEYLYVEVEMVVLGDGCVDLVEVEDVEFFVMYVGVELWGVDGVFLVFGFDLGV